MLHNKQLKDIKMSEQLLIGNIKEKIELHFKNYHIEGEAVMHHWWGRNWIYSNETIRR